MDPRKLEFPHKTIKYYIIVQEEYMYGETAHSVVYYRNQRCVLLFGLLLHRTLFMHNTFFLSLLFFSVPGGSIVTGITTYI